ncbi:MAG: M17 family peptidase N-terminal domain-containing protein [Streptosporangiaceae bacterium]
MPVVGDVALLPAAGSASVGAYLAGAAHAEGGPAELAAVAVGADGREPADPALDALLPATAAQVIAAYGLTGKAGEAAELVTLIGGRAVRVVLLGIGDSSAEALRRAGAELGRRARGKAAVLSALRRLGVACRVTGLVAAAENMPSGSAYRPGDVITQYGGRTVEVLNTDAEGRLVLADALAYADARLQPDYVVDIATLTGAARVALGTSYAALYATDDALARALAAAGAGSGDRVWRMPLADPYARALESPVADLAHIARDGSPAGSIVAALFLREFAGQSRWAHLDIAGAGRAGTDDGELTKGATGFGTRLLLRWLTGVPA